MDDVTVFAIRQACVEEVTIEFAHGKEAYRASAEAQRNALVLPVLNWLSNHSIGKL